MAPGRDRDVVAALPVEHDEGAAARHVRRGHDAPGLDAVAPKVRQHHGRVHILAQPRDKRDLSACAGRGDSLVRAFAAERLRKNGVSYRFTHARQRFYLHDKVHIGTADYRNTLIHVRAHNRFVFRLQGSF